MRLLLHLNFPRSRAENRGGADRYARARAAALQRAFASSGRNPRMMHARLKATRGVEDIFAALSLLIGGARLIRAGASHLAFSRRDRVDARDCKSRSLLKSLQSRI